jgi:hypothetical protein
MYPQKRQYLRAAAHPHDPQSSCPQLALLPLLQIQIQIRPRYQLALFERASLPPQ